MVASNASRAIREIVIHCTATHPTWWEGKRTSAKAQEVKRWHVQENGWKDIGYHYLIDRDGTIATGRPVSQVGAHVQGHNTGTIGISLFGAHGAAATDTFPDHFTVAQDKALRTLIAELRNRFPVIVKVSGHNEYAVKGCPGFDVTKWLNGDAVKPAAKPEPINTPAAVEPALVTADTSPPDKTSALTALVAFLASVIGFLLWKGL